MTVAAETIRDTFLLVATNELEAKYLKCVHFDQKKLIGHVLGPYTASLRSSQNKVLYSVEMALLTSASPYATIQETVLARICEPVLSDWVTSRWPCNAVTWPAGLDTRGRIILIRYKFVIFWHRMPLTKSYLYN